MFDPITTPPQQGARSIEFRTLAASSRCLNKVLVDIVLQGLSSTLEDELVAREVLEELEKLIRLAVRIDREMMAQRREERHPTDFSTSLPMCFPPMQSNSQASHLVSTPDLVLVQLQSQSLSPTERRKHMGAGLCLHCRQHGHPLHDCQGIPRSRSDLVSRVSSFISPFQPPAMVLVAHAGVQEEFECLTHVRMVT